MHLVAVHSGLWPLLIGTNDAGVRRKNLKHEEVNGNFYLLFLGQ